MTAEAFKDFMGALAVAIAVAAYAIYVWQSFRGETRPHPLSWLIFGILTGAGYLVQLDEAAGPASWVMAITTAVCLLLCVMSFWRGERVFSLVRMGVPRRRGRRFYFLSAVAAADAVRRARLFCQRARLRPDRDQALGRRATA